MADATTDLIIRARQEMQDAVKGFESLKGKLKGVEKNLGTLEKKAKVSASKMTVAFKKAGDGLTKASNRIGGAFRGMLGQATALLGTAGIVGLFVKATRAAGDFEASMANVSTLIKTDVTVTMNKYREIVLALSKETGESTDILSQSLFKIISATVKGSESVEGASKVMEAASKLAIAGVTDTMSATTALTTVLNSYEMSADKAAETSDKLVQIAQLADTTFGALAPEFGKVAAIAKSADVSLDELGGVIIALTAGGREVNMAMTDFRAVVMALTKPSKELTAVYKKHGIESGSLAIKERGLVEVLKLLRTEAAGSFDVIQKFIPQQEAAAARSILLGSGLERVASGAKAVGKAVGTTEEAYAKMSETFEFKTRRFKALMNETFIKLGQAILPIVIEKLELFSKWVNKNGDEIVVFFKDVFTWFTKFGEFVLENGAAIAYTLGTIFALGKISSFLTKLEGIGRLMSKGGVLGIGLGLFATGLGVATVAAAALAGKLKDVKKEAKEMVDAMHEAYTGLTLEILGPETKKGFEIAERFFKQAIDLAEKGTPGAIGLFWGEEAAAEKEIDAMIARLKKGLIETRKLAAGEASAIEEELKEATKQAFLRAGGEEEDFFWAPKAVGRKYEAIVKAKIDDLESMKNELEYAAETMGRKAKEVTEKPVDAPGGVRTKEQIAAMKKLTAARMTAAKRIRALEIAAMDKIAQVRAVMEDKIAALRANKLLTIGLREKEIDLLRTTAEKKIDDLRAAAQKKIHDAEMKPALKRAALFKKIDEVTAKAAAEYHKIRVAAEETAKKIRENHLIWVAAQEDKISQMRLRVMDRLIAGDVGGAVGTAISNSLSDALSEELGREWGETLGDAMGEELGDALTTVMTTIADIGMTIFEKTWGMFYLKALDQVMELIDLGLELAGEGVTPGEPGEGGAADRLTETLDKMVAWWENVVAALPGILDWLTNTALPKLFDAIMESLPKIMDTLNEMLPKLMDKIIEYFPRFFEMANQGFRDMLPILVDMVLDLVIALIDELPGIIQAIVDGILAALAKLVSRIPELIRSIISFVGELVGIILELITQGIPELVAEIIKMLPEIVKALIVGIFKDFLPMLVKAIGDALKNIFSGDSPLLPWNWFHEGGMVGSRYHDGGMIGGKQFADNVAMFGAAVRAHNGLFVSPGLAADEVPIIAQAGEAVLSRAGVAAAGGETGIDALNAGVSPGAGAPTTINNIVNTDYLFGEEAADVIDRLQGENLLRGTGDVADAINRGKVSGFGAKA